MNLRSLSKSEKNSLIGGQIFGLFTDMQSQNQTEDGIDLKDMRTKLSRLIDLIEEIGVSEMKVVK